LKNEKVFINKLKDGLVNELKSYEQAINSPYKEL